MICLLWVLWTVSTDVPNRPIFKDHAHHSSFKDSSRWTARENIQHCCDKGHLEKSNPKHIVLHTLWLLVSGFPFLIHAGMSCCPFWSASSEKHPKEQPTSWNNRSGKSQLLTPSSKHGKKQIIPLLPNCNKIKPSLSRWIKQNYLS